MTTQAKLRDNPKELMDKIYRYTRHVYDASRKYFLLGRDKLITGLDAGHGDVVCEIGCGTARNLIKMAERYSGARFVGLDASDEMLKTARKNLEKAKQEYHIDLKQAYAQDFDPLALFNVTQFQKIVFSYSLSMIPPWRDSIDHALTLLPKGGEIHIVDFGQQEDQPRWFKKFLFWFLDLFHVHPEPGLENYLRELEQDNKASVEIRRLYKGYAFLAVMRKL